MMGDLERTVQILSIHISSEEVLSTGPASNARARAVQMLSKPIEMKASDGPINETKIAERRKLDRAPAT